ncbi:hypothetical protein FLA105534_04170 [Flavobacterium bizetiae]|uniref:Uncharacterized protein n=1 Tax=Flavobacterium bizetiae TaxID=2704140 RepID=A0A6J4GW88_9FLAO|nr:hypothetical protein FLA105534_04170 [Flavobacterium bizetiae]CAD5344480.1 hypothetical protein FLA105535_04486 [Flavobacterium bizetiae]CAD5350296.1 hypothetical protein FLA105534_04286 [Flavobacterium bizetiae]
MQKYGYSLFLQNQRLSFFDYVVENNLTAENAKICAEFAKLFLRNIIFKAEGFENVIKSKI